MSTNTNTFHQLSLNLSLIKNLESMNYVEMTPVQALTLPVILSGKDVIAKAKTGSGKTAAFGLGILSTNFHRKLCDTSVSDLSDS